MFHNWNYIAIAYFATSLQCLINLVYLLFEQTTPRVKVKLILAAHFVALKHLFNVRYSTSSQIEFVDHFAVVQLQVVTEHELGLRGGHLLLDLGVRVVYDRHEHVQQNEEADEDEAHEEERTKDGKVGSKSYKVEVSEQGAEQSEHGLREGLIVRNGLTKQRVAHGAVRKEDNEEDYDKVNDVTSGLFESRVELIEGTIQGNVLEDLYPSKEDPNYFLISEFIAIIEW